MEEGSFSSERWRARDLLWESSCRAGGQLHGGARDVPFEGDHACDRHATDLKFTLSRRSVPMGSVIFTVTNRGKLSHDFKIAGKKTPRLLPGHSATLRITFSKKGRYPYLSTVSGQASPA